MAGEGVRRMGEHDHAIAGRDHAAHTLHIAFAERKIVQPYDGQCVIPRKHANGFVLQQRDVARGEDLPQAGHGNIVVAYHGVFAHGGREGGNGLKKFPAALTRDLVSSSSCISSRLWLV